MKPHVQEETLSLKQFIYSRQAQMRLIIEPTWFLTAEFMENRRRFLQITAERHHSTTRDKESSEEPRLFVPTKNDQPKRGQNSLNETTGGL